MVTGAGVAFREGTHILPVLLLLLAALALFWLRTPVESLLGTSAMRAQTSNERRLVAIVIAGLVTVAGLALGTLLGAARNPLLWLIGVASVIALVGQSLLKLMWRQPPRLSSQGEARRHRGKPFTHQFRMLSEIVGTIGLTASGPAAYYVMTGKFGSTAWMLWIANLVFAGNQIHYVQLRIHSARVEGFRAKLAHGWAFALGQSVMTGALALACLLGLLSTIVSIAFSPLLFRGWFYFIQKARAISCTETRLARADSGNRILRPFHIRLRTDKLRPASCRLSEAPLALALGPETKAESCTQVSEIRKA